MMSVLRRTPWLLIMLGLIQLAPASLFAQSLAKNPIVKCMPNIANCGCTITSSGIYMVSAKLSSSQGLTASGDCIDVQASNVRLFLQGNDITNPNTVGSRTGIHLLKSAKGAFVEGTAGGFETPFSTISGWLTGIEVESSNTIIEDFSSSSNIDDGVDLLNVRNDNLSNFNTQNNGGVGLLLAGSSMSQINFAFLTGNADGLFIGDIRGKLNSTGNFIYDLTANENASQGIVIPARSTGNVVTDITGFGNGDDDFFDGNGCGQNLWTLNSFTKANLGCIH